MGPHAGSEVVEVIHHLVEWAALGIEVLAVVVIVAAVIILTVTRGTIRYLFHRGAEGAYESYKHQLGKAVLLALDLLVAGDVIKTIALESTLNNIAVLGLLVFVRTFLSWSLVVEIEGHWPWQTKVDAGSRGVPEQGGDGTRDV